MTATGRRAGMPPARRVFESLLQVAYRGDWPARLWQRVAGTPAVRLERHRLTAWRAGARPGRLVFVSDLHIGPTTPLPLLEHAFDLVREAAPDVLVLGGDYVFLDATPARLDVLRRLVSSVHAGTTLAVLGNHDLWTDYDAITAALTDAGATVLVNQAVALPGPWADIAVVGLDDPWTGQCDAPAAFAQAGDAAVRVVVCHGPDGIAHLAGFDFRLYVCGHTHGGHVASPWGPVVVPEGRLCRRYPAGFARAHDADVFVSRGLGGIEVPFRVFAPPDILLVDW